MPCRFENLGRTLWLYDYVTVWLCVCAFQIRQLVTLSRRTTMASDVTAPGPAEEASVEMDFTMPYTTELAQPPPQPQVGYRLRLCALTYFYQFMLPTFIESAICVISNLL